jgi:pyruvate formate lyase activating enzyme
VFDVQRYSLHDGPGMRTSVFMKGCPLRCGWCANPESQLAAPELALSADRCIACGQFATTCAVGWKSPDVLEWSKERQEEYAGRAAACPTGAIHWIGIRRTAGDIMSEVLRDAAFYDEGGGMTLTGGEPTMQPHLAEALLILARNAGLTTAMETCGHTRWSVFESLLPHLDTVLFDVKHLDSETHRRATGVGNELILANLHHLVNAGAHVVLRIPVVPGFNDDIAHFDRVADLAASLGGAVRRIDLLPYHALGRAKYRALGRAYPWDGFDAPTDELVSQLAQRLTYFGLETTIGGQV